MPRAVRDAVFNWFVFGEVNPVSSDLVREVVQQGGGRIRDRCLDSFETRVHESVDIDTRLTLFHVVCEIQDDLDCALYVFDRVMVHGGHFIDGDVVDLVRLLHSGERAR